MSLTTGSLSPGSLVIGRTAVDLDVLRNLDAEDVFWDLDGVLADFDNQPGSYREWKWSDWASLRTTETYKLMREYVRYVVSSPGTSEGCKGKAIWCQKYLRCKLILTSEKHLLAKEGRWLVDDYAGNINKWCLAGGNGYWLQGSRYSMTTKLDPRVGKDEYDWAI